MENEPVTYHPVNNPGPSTTAAPGAPAPAAPAAAPAAPQVLEKEIQITQFGQPRIINYTDKKTQQPRTFTVYYLTGNDGITYEVSQRDWLADKKIGDVIKIKYIVVTNQGANGQVYTNYRLELPSLPERVAVLEKKVNTLIGTPVATPAPVTPAPTAPAAPAPAPVAKEDIPVIESPEPVAQPAGGQVEDTPPAMPF